MVSRKDWLKKTLPELNVMFTNVQGKIADYKVPYGLTTAWVERVQVICATFIAGYMGVVQSRATMKDMNEWFENLLYGEPKGAPATAPPIFATVLTTNGAFIGLIDEFREMMRFFKANAAYTVADGENLMIVAPIESDGDINDAVPELKVSVDVNNAVSAAYVRENFSGLELHWRKDGETLWQLADKSTETVITFTPPGITLPQKIELRGVYILKNSRVGNWSPMYTVTIG